MNITFRHAVQSWLYSPTKCQHQSYFSSPFNWGILIRYSILQSPIILPRQDPRPPHLLGRKITMQTTSSQLHTSVCDRGSGSGNDASPSWTALQKLVLHIYTIASQSGFLARRVTMSHAYSHRALHGSPPMLILVRYIISIRPLGVCSSPQLRPCSFRKVSFVIW